MENERMERESLEERVAFYEKEFSVKLNPLTWGKNGKKK